MLQHKMKLWNLELAQLALRSICIISAMASGKGEAGLKMEVAFEKSPQQ